MASSRTELMLSMHPCIMTQSTQLRNASCINDTDPTDNDCVPINAPDATNFAHYLLGISKTIHAVAHSTFAPTIPQTQQNFGTIGHNKIWTQLNTSMVLISSFHPYLQQNLMMSADRKYQSHLSLHIQKKLVHRLNRWVQRHRVLSRNLRELWQIRRQTHGIALVQTAIMESLHDNTPTIRRMHT